VVAAVAAVVGDDGTQQHSRTVGVEGVVARLHPMVIVPVGLAPQVLPAFEDHCTDDLRESGRPPVLPERTSHAGWNEAT